MKFSTRSYRLIAALALAVAGLAVSGCAVLGPNAIRGSRAAYNDAIVITNNQQVLAMIVRMRYGEPAGLLTVSSVTANLHVQSSLGAEFGIGDDQNFDGNLTPLSAGIAYEENPTISYTPVQGEAYLRQVLSPLPIDLMVLLLGALGNSPQAMTLLCGSINGIQNPDFLVDDAGEADPRFARIAELLAELNQAGNTTWAQEPGEPPSFALVITGDGAAYAQRVNELYGLLGFAVPSDLSHTLTLPVELGFGKPEKMTIRIRTRSLWQLINIAAASVEVPVEHLESGLAPRLPRPGTAAQNIHIRGSNQHPQGAMIAVKHHDYWYSIDGTDAVSKLTFRILEALISVRMAEATEKKAAPILTVPVSR